MRVGTKSLLFGVHCFFLHPFFVAWGWWQLYGFPWDPRLWLAFVVHDWGYWGCPNMDGPEGEWHPALGAKIMARLFGDEYKSFYGTTPYCFMFYHSRALAKKYGCRSSKLCWADKMALALTPWWMYIPMARATGEIQEYRRIKKHTDEVGRYEDFDTDREWFAATQAFMRKQATSNKHYTL